MKKIILMLLTFSLLFSFAACDGAEDVTDTAAPAAPETSDTAPETKPEETEPKETEPADLEYKTTKLNSSTAGVKILGERNLASKKEINCDWSCSGIELKINCNGGDIKFAVTTQGGSASFRAFLDGKEWVKNDGTLYYDINTSGVVKLSNVPAGVHTVRVMKVSGYTISRASISSVTYSGSIETTAPADGAKYIEFVGDSIGCAWGTIGEHKGAHTDQDGTLAYTYLLADALGADYSMTALSGQGLLCGNPGMKDGYKYASPMRDRANEYTFERKADLVVINIGTNDDYQKNEAGITAASFKAAYKAFIEYVRQKNGADCKILCLYNCMNDGYGTQIAEVCTELGGSAAGIECVKLDRANGNQHPNIAEHQGYFTKLKPIVEALLK